MLQMKDAAYAYGAGRGVDGISLEIARGGSLLALAGPNGAGKSTLLKLIARVLVPQRGEILFEGKREWDAKEYARRVAYLS